MTGPVRSGDQIGGPVRIVVPDLVSPSYFPALAAVELGCVAERGVEAVLSLHFPLTAAVDALRAGEVDVVVGSAHAVCQPTADAGEVSLLAALSRYTYWFLVVRADLGMGRNAELALLRGLRIATAPGPDAALRQMLTDAGVEPADVDLVPVPAAPDASFGVSAADALAAGRIDGFWANGVAAELAVRRRVGTVVVDARRGDGPQALRTYTFAAVLSTRRLERDRPAALGAVVAGLVDAQARLRRRPELARRVADRLFPPTEADLAETLVARDAPYYDAAITESAVADMGRFAQQQGWTGRSAGMDVLVSERFRPLWAHAGQ